MQTSSMSGKSITVLDACKELSKDMAQNGMKGIFSGQGLGLAKAIVSLSMFHEGRMFLTRRAKSYNGTLN